MSTESTEASNRDAEFERTLQRLFPQRTPPIGFYPLPTQRLESTQFRTIYRPFPTRQARHGLIYVHVPFCRQRCAFCRFYPGRYDSDRAQTFIDAAVLELQWWGAHRAIDSGSAPVEAVFLGGGSPSALDSRQLLALLNAMRDHFPFVAQPEITMECYPKEASGKFLSEAAELGVNRLSLGIQTWKPRVADALGLHHSAEDSEKALHAAFNSPITNINIDIMANAPQQTIQDHLDDVTRALGWEPSMISLNPLERAYGTPLSAFTDEGADFADPNAKRSWLRASTSLLREKNYVHQRVRNLRTRDGIHIYNRRSRGIDFDIIPVGPGAYGYVGNWALANAPDWASWETAVKANGTSVIGVAPPEILELRRSFVISSLLELELDAESYHHAFGTELELDFPRIRDFVKLGAFDRLGPYLRLSPRAMLYADDIAGTFYSDAQGELFDRHLSVRRSEGASQYFPVARP